MKTITAPHGCPALLLAAWLVLATGCSSTPAQTHDAASSDLTADTHSADTGLAPDSAPSDTAPTDTASLDTSLPDTSPPDIAQGDTADVSTPWSFEALAAEYGIIETVAGLGTIQDKAVSGWLSSYEGGAATAAELSRPHITVGDAAGNLYIADKDAHAVRMVGPDGRISTVAGTSVAGDDGDGPGLATAMRLSSPNGVWVRSDGTLYILDLDNDKVRVRETDGTMRTLFPIGGAGAGRGLWVADDASLAYVAADTQLKRWTPSGGVEVLAAGFVSLANLVVDSDGDVIVADRLGHRVYRVDPTTGAKTVVAGNGTALGGGEGFSAVDTGLDEVRGVWLHPRGGMFLATHKGGQVWYMDSASIMHLFVDGDANDTHAGDGAPYDLPGAKISEPRAITMDAAGNVIITENDYGYVRRVRRIQP